MSHRITVAPWLGSVSELENDYTLSELPYIALEMVAAQEGATGDEFLYIDYMIPLANGSFIVVHKDRPIRN